MIFLWAALVLLLNSVWLFLVLFGLPGNWLMVLTAGLLTWWTSHPSVVSVAVDAGNRVSAVTVESRSMFSMATLAVVAGIALAAEVYEFIAGMTGSRKAGGTWRGSVGAIFGGLVGAVVGTFFVPVFGSLLGACLGAALGAWGFELAGGAQPETAMRSGVGAGVGRFIGTLVKLGAGVLIWVILAVAAFWP